MTATVALTALDDERQARFDAEVKALLADMIRRAIRIRRAENVQP
jgi:hypothetical protein